jgi:hypothetical protein
VSVNGVGSFDTHNSFKESAFSTAADGGSSDTHNALSEHDSFKESAYSNAAEGYIARGCGRSFQGINDLDGHLEGYIARGWAEVSKGPRTGTSRLPTQRIL